MTRYDEYRSEYRDVQREAYWTMPRILMFMAITLVGISGVFFVVNWMTAATRILTPEKAISNYEWFHDTHNEFQSRVNQLASHRKIVAETTDPSERVRLRVEVGGIQASCRSLAVAYNSRAAQIHRGLFQGSSVPSKLEIGKCE